MTMLYAIHHCVWHVVPMKNIFLFFSKAAEKAVVATKEYSEEKNMKKISHDYHQNQKKIRIGKQTIGMGIVKVSVFDPVVPSSGELLFKAKQN